MARGRPPLRPGWAERIRPLIPSETEDRDISVSGLMDATGLGYMQVQAGVGWLRDNQPDLPLVSSRAGYRFTTDPRRVRSFRRWRAATAYTILRRLYRGAIAPYLHTLPDRGLAQLVERQFERVLQDIETLIASGS